MLQHNFFLQQTGRSEWPWVGLTPTVAEVDAFLADKSADAYEKQVERLLKSPHYGERWGRHWLDAARYADSDGFEKDKSRQISFAFGLSVNPRVLSSLPGLAWLSMCAPTTRSGGLLSVVPHGTKSTIRKGNSWKNGSVRNCRIAFRLL